MDDGVSILKFFSAFVLVIALMWLFSWIIKRSGLGGAIPVTKNSKKRLKLVEILPVDHSRRIVLVRRDDKEHLLLLSPNGDNVIETDIKADISGDKENEKS